jgi:predicted  nucleic acid-binding Zn-ribbon protein
MERRMKKAQSASKFAKTYKRENKENERTMHRMRKEINDLKDQNKLLNNRVTELNSQSRPAHVPRVQSAHTSS